MRETPFDSITNLLSPYLPSELLKFVPNKWEKIGDVVTLKLPDELKSYQEVIGKVLADVLHCKSVLNDVGGISGVYREPNVVVMYGSQQTETIHMENGVRYCLDPQKIMFSSGNMDERRRMATISNPKETVVDLFAGIGYFTLPMAVFSKPKAIVGCEINPVAYQYLCKNIVLNHVTDIVSPLLGDNRKTAPKNCADRVILGYLEDTHSFLPVAFNCLKDHKGVLHFHDVFPAEMGPDKPMHFVQKVAEEYDRSVELIRCKSIKSYAPGIDHVVLDIRVGK